MKELPPETDPRTPAPVAATLRLLRRGIEELGKDDLAGLAAQMGYYFMLALFPLLILLLGLIELLPIEQDLQRVLDRLLQGLPPEVIGLLRGFVRDFMARPPSGGLLLWILAAIWASSRGMRGARRGLDGVLGAGGDRRRRIPGPLRDLLFTLASVLFVGAAYLLVLGGRWLGAFTAETFELDALFPVLWTWLRWPLTVLLLSTFLGLAYLFLPDRHVRVRHAAVGAIPACIAWLGLLGGYRSWLRLTGHFDRVYGSLASFFLLMVLLWLFSLVFLLGGEIVAWRASRADRRGQ